MERYHDSPQGTANHAERLSVHRRSRLTFYMLTPITVAAFTMFPHGARSVVSAASEADHSRMRRVLAPGFSEKAVREQEPLIQEYVDLLMNLLHEASVKGPQNIVSWYELIAFDIIGMWKSVPIEAS